MKVAISATGTELTSLVDPRFGRCPYFLIVETDTMSVEAFPNESAEIQGGAGIYAARFVVDKGVSAVLTGHCGPNARLTFEAAGVPCYEALGNIPIGEAIQKLIEKKITAVADLVSPMMGRAARGEIGFGGGCIGKGFTGRRARFGQMSDQID